MNSEVYLDANATSPTLPAAIDAAVDAMQARYGNPSSSHAAGLRARALLEGARASAKAVTGASEGDIIFTSGATEAIQTAVLSALCAVRARQLAGEASSMDLLVYGATEHKAVPECLAHWNRILGTGLTLTALPVDGAGRHRLDVLAALAPRAALVCTMAANNETGVVSDLAAIEALLAQHAPQALWLVDCVQALGKLPLNLAATRIDYAPFSGHKIYAPKGIGMLYVRRGAPFTPLMVGGGQEGGLRSGTENMAGIAAFGAVLAALEQGGVRGSAGSACSAAKAAPSHVLVAMGCADERAGSAVRLSFSPTASDEFVARACARIVRCGAALRDWQRPASAAPAADALPIDAGADIAPGRLAAFLADHPGACLVDVREAFEHAAGEQAEWHGRPIASIPLSVLGAHVPALLDQREQAVVLFCRSGNRSARALAMLRRAGHPHAYHLQGGLALSPG